MLSLPEKMVFVILAVICAYLTAHSFKQVVEIVRRGKGRLYLEQLPARLWRALEITFTQRTTLSARPLTGLFHIAIVWGFLFYGLVNVGDVLYGFLPGYTFLGTGPLGDLYRLLADVLSIGVIIGMSYFLVRRFFTSAPALRYNDRVLLHPWIRAGGIRRDSAIVGAFILTHVGARFMGETLRLAQHGANTGQPFASVVSGLWSGVQPELLIVGEHLAWWLALGVILVFVPWFPRTKHFHLMMAPFNYLTRPQRRSPGALDRLDLEDDAAAQFGAAKLEDLAQTQIVDAYACIMCNRCQDACPAYAAGTELSPAALEVNKRYFLKQHMDLLANGGTSPITLFESALTVEGTWACTACAACVEICPVGNEPMFDIIDLRRYLVLTEGQPPNLLAGAMTQAERTGDPWGNPRGTRLHWAAGLTVPLLAERQQVDVLYWVGCAGAYDPAGQRVSRAMVKILQAAGVDFAVLGDEERCTCEWARRGGNEALYQQAAQTLIETFNRYTFNLILTQCPHCFHTFKNEYPDFGGHYTVVHHSQYIARLLAEGRIQPKPTRKRKKDLITYHDSCFLGRYNGEYEGPRSALAAVPTLELVEMPRRRNRGFCCGGGGAQVWMETHQVQPINTNRLEEALATNAKTVSTACPFCAIMLSSAAQSQGVTDRIKVRDIAEIVADSL